jgi:isobutyryl-CoA mutase
MRDEMEPGDQRGKFQEESLHYEHLKHTGENPIIGVNTLRNPHGDQTPDTLELARSTEEERQGQSQRLRAFQERNQRLPPEMLQKLKHTVI